ncbi:MAG: TIGR04282 family arsenosugar biosynthesis glycosyltransferase [Thermoleophilaceae bacterium]
MSALIVIAKAPVPGRSKTRLCPPCTPEQAAQLAGAALGDTLAAVAGAGATRRVLALEGEPGDWLPAGFEVIPQRGRGLEQRLAAAFEDCGGTAFLVAMDTPQLTPVLLDAALARLEAPGTGAVLGATRDGGYWGIGLCRPDRTVFAGVPMSSLGTHAAQRERLAALGLRTAALPVLTDVDTIAAARAVARLAPRTRFAARLRESGHAADDRQPVAEATA